MSELFSLTTSQILLSIISLLLLIAVSFDHKISLYWKQVVSVIFLMEVDAMIVYQYFY